MGRIGLGFLLIVAFSVGLAAVLIGIGLVVVYARRLVARFGGTESTARWCGDGCPHLRGGDHGVGVDPPQAQAADAPGRHHAGRRARDGCLWSPRSDSAHPGSATPSTPITAAVRRWPRERGLGRAFGAHRGGGHTSAPGAGVASSGSSSRSRQLESALERTVGLVLVVLGATSSPTVGVPRPRARSRPRRCDPSPRATTARRTRSIHLSSWADALPDCSTASPGRGLTPGPARLIGALVYLRCRAGLTAGCSSASGLVGFR
jgi:hypothetical protein